MAKRKKRLTAKERARMRVELDDVQREVRALIDFLRTKLGEKRPADA